MGLVWEFESHAQLSPHYRLTFPKWHGLDFDPQPTPNNSLVKLMYLIMKKESTRMSSMYCRTLFILLFVTLRSPKPWQPPPFSWYFWKVLGDWG
jgi:hypothetical protein